MGVSNNTGNSNVIITLTRFQVNPGAAIYLTIVTPVIDITLISFSHRGVTSAVTIGHSNFVISSVFTVIDSQRVITGISTHIDSHRAYDTIQILRLTDGNIIFTLTGINRHFTDSLAQTVFNRDSVYRAAQIQGEVLNRIVISMNTTDIQVIQRQDFKRIPFCLSCNNRVATWPWCKHRTCVWAIWVSARRCSICGGNRISTGIRQYFSYQTTGIFKVLCCIGPRFTQHSDSNTAQVTQELILLIQSLFQCIKIDIAGCQSSLNIGQLTIYCGDLRIEASLIRQCLIIITLGFRQISLSFTDSIIRGNVASIVAIVECICV